MMTSAFSTAPANEPKSCFSHRPDALSIPRRRHSLVAPLAPTRYLRLSENARAVFFLGRTGNVPLPAEQVGGRR